MRLPILILTATLAAAAPAAAESDLSRPAPIPAPADTTVRVRFEIAARPLTEALSEFSRQATIHVQVDVAAAASIRSRALSGAYTPPEALRRLLEGTGMAVRFADGET